MKKLPIIDPENKKYVSDCTLRDAVNAPGMYLELEEKLKIAHLLDSFHIDEIEAGVISGDKKEDKILKQFALSNYNTPVSWAYFCSNAQKMGEILSQLENFNFKRIFISIPSSEDFIKIKLRRSLRATLVLLDKVVSEAVSRGFTVIFSGEDAARADMDFLKEYIKVGQDAGAQRFRFAESISCLNPEIMKSKMEILTQSLEIPIEVHCHSGYGLAVSNSLAAMNAGAKWISTTIEGIGERGGNTSLGVILLYLKQFNNQQDLDLSKLKEVSDYFSHLTKNPIHRFHSIVGKDAFTYEIFNQYSNYSVYEDYPPELVGNQRNLAIGSKLDPASLEYFLGSEIAGSIGEELHETIQKTVQNERNYITKEKLLTLIKQTSYERI